MKHFLLFLFFFQAIILKGQDNNKKNKTQFGVSVSANYSFSGISVIPTFDLILNKHIIYVGSKFLTSVNYLPNKGPWGINVGYKHEFRNTEGKKLSFFFIADYQMISSKSFSRIKDTKKRNYYHELFLGYGMQLRFFDHLYIGNAMGVGAHMEIFNNVDLSLKETFLGYNNLFRVFIHYRF
ncbi:hypothetical protein [Sporocytophaga myxococcoides]|uniref:hypothetical protein n=1 Tax=Sporocytophaga myxococcoides TaxID=153721 RepID=UPI0012DC8866|nr:hypothetical protein [Sporocytophaga myxococcoides]